MHRVEEKEVVAAILKAEFDSSRFGDKVQTALAHLVLKPDLDSIPENMVREKLLDYRGFRDRTHLFQGFPQNVEWSKTTLTKDDFARLEYGRHEDWIALSEGTRKVLHAASRLNLLLDLRKQFPVVMNMLPGVFLEHHLPLVVCNHKGRLVLIEGHARATAYGMRFPPSGVHAYIAESPDMEAWVWL